MEWFLSYKGEGAFPKKAETSWVSDYARCTLNFDVETIQRYSLIAKLRRPSCLCMALLYLSTSTLSKMSAKTMRATIRTSA